MLTDSLREEEHPAAARDILRALRVGARGLLELQPSFPQLASPTVKSDEQFLVMLGDHIDGIIKSRGLDWPPPRTVPPPSLTIDLIYLYRCASQQIIPHGADPSLLLRDKLIKVERQCRVILESWNGHSRRIGAAKQVVIASDAGPRSRIGAFISGVGLAVSLIQGPGAMHDLPEDLGQFGGDVASIADMVTTGLSRILDDISDVIQPFVR